MNIGLTVQRLASRHLLLEEIRRDKSENLIHLHRWNRVHISEVQFSFSQYQPEYREVRERVRLRCIDLVPGSTGSEVKSYFATARVPVLSIKDPPINRPKASRKSRL